MKYKKSLFVLGVVVISFMVINIIVESIRGVNVLTNTVAFFKDRLAPNNEEIVSVGLSSEGYDKKQAGSYNIKKSAKWTGADTALITFSVDTNIKSRESNKDIVLVLDISGSMEGDKINRVKHDSKELVESLLKNKENKVALITFESKSRIEYELTSDKDAIISKIDSIVPTENTNYNLALMNVDKVLEGYKQKEDRDLIVLFLTDGYPNEDTPNEIAQYKLLKDKYPFIVINGVQYEMGAIVIDDLKRISDNQYFADMETLNNVLFDAAVDPMYYEKFEIVDYIDNRYFYVESVDDIIVPFGKVKLEDEEGVQKVTWTTEKEIRTGIQTKMDIKVKLKEQYVNNAGYYPTNLKEEIRTKLPLEKEKIQVSDETPVLKSEYRVTYDTNTPAGCSLDNFEETHFVYENVKISESKLSCDGYRFAGWKVYDKVTKINDEYFVMPSKDVTIKAIWVKHGITKSMDGKVYEKPTLYEDIASQAVLDNLPSEFVTSPTGIDFSATSSTTNGIGVYTVASTIGDSNPIHYYRGAVKNNNVIFAGHCWHIIRTTENGGVRLIYNGVPNNGVCDNTGSNSIIGTSRFAHDLWSMPHLGFMYGPTSYSGGTMSKEYKDTNYLYGNDVVYENGVYKLTDPIESNITNDYTSVKNKHHYTCFNLTGECESVAYLYYDYEDPYYVRLKDGETIETLVDKVFLNTGNTVDSYMKDTLDSWYESKMVNYTKYLEDSVYCNDRGIATYGGFKKNNNSNSSLNFAGYNRAAVTYEPSLACRLNDSFTVDSTNGNGALTYPVGILNIDELMYAGGVENINSPNHYLNIGYRYWTMTPTIFYVSYPVVWFVNYDGGGYYGTANGWLGVRPVVTLKADIQFTDGDGRIENPYIIME